MASLRMCSLALLQTISIRRTDTPRMRPYHTQELFEDLLQLFSVTKTIGGGGGNFAGP